MNDFKKKSYGSVSGCFYCGENSLCKKKYFIPKHFNSKLKVYTCLDCELSKGNLKPTAWMKILNLDNNNKNRRRIVAVLSLIKKMSSNKLNKGSYSVLEVQFIKDNIELMDLPVIADYLNRTVVGIKQKALSFQREKRHK